MDDDTPISDVPDPTITPDEPAAGGPEPVEPAAEPVSKPDKSKPDPDALLREKRSLTQRVAAVAKERDALKAQLRERDERIAELEAQLGELDPMRERLTAYEQREAERRKARMEALPDDLRELIPDGLDGDPLDTLLGKLEARAAAAPAPKPKPPADRGARTGAGGGGDPEALTDAEEAFAKAQRGWWDGPKLIVTPALVKRAYAKHAAAHAPRK